MKKVKNGICYIKNGWTYISICCKPYERGFAYGELISQDIIKVKKIACKSLKGRGVNSGLRLIYAYFPDEQIITFVEIYHKNDKDLEDRARITNQFL